MTIQILDSAKIDLINGFNFYENLKVGLGDYFLNSIYSDIDSLKLNAGIHQIKFNKYHVLLAEKFPFAVYYKLIDQVVKIYAVLDCRQNPETISSRLDS